MKLGERIDRQRTRLGMSQSELARRVGVRQSTINSLIRGESYSSRHLLKIARELHVTPAYLAGEVDDPELDAPDGPTLSAEEVRWLDVFKALDSRSRGALLQIAETMVTGMNQPTVNSPKPANQGEE